MNSNSAIEKFLDGSPFAVVGASSDREKYGNKVLRTFLQKDRQVFPVNPNSQEIEGVEVCSSLSEIGEPIHGISIITPPHVTETIVEEAIDLGIKNIWMQPGAESQTAIDSATAAGINLIANGPCILVVMGFRESG